MAKKEKSPKAKEVKPKMPAYITLIVIFMIGIPLFAIGAFLLTRGSLFEVPPEVNPDTSIGYCKFTLILTNASAGRETVNGTFELIDFYNQTNVIADNVSADGETVYYVSNATIAYLRYVNTTNGLSYPNASFLVIANKSQAFPFNNIITINPLIQPSEFNAVIFKMNDVFGSFGIGSIPSANFTMSVGLSNTGNGTAGERYYIPKNHRFNETEYETALWLKVNKVVNSVIMGSNTQRIFYDGNGNSFIGLSKLFETSTRTLDLQFQCEEKPTQFDFINGQWNETVLKTMV